MGMFEEYIFDGFRRHLIAIEPDATEAVNGFRQYKKEHKEKQPSHRAKNFKLNKWEKK